MQIRLFLLLAFLGLSACDDDPMEPDDGVRTYEFAIEGRSDDFNFFARTSDANVIDAVEAQLALPEDERRQFINGTIERGNGGYNDDWNWHFVPGEWDLTEAAIELCDGNPQLVEADLDYWVDTVGRFCPWGAYVVGEVE